MQACFEKDVVHVHVADAAHVLLIHQEGLDLCLFAFDERRKVVKRKAFIKRVHGYVLGIWLRGQFVALYKQKLSEPPKADRVSAAIFKHDLDLVLFRCVLLVFEEQHIGAHPQGEEDVLVVTELCDYPLPFVPDISDLCTADPLREFNGLNIGAFLLQKLDRTDGFPT